MKANLHEEFVEKCEKIKQNILPNLEMFYGDSNRWADASSDLVSYGVFYSIACNKVFKSTLLWGYNPGPIANQFLLPVPTVELNEETFQRHHYGLLVEYCLNRVVTVLLIEGRLETGILKEASSYHQKHLMEYGYGNVVEAIEELDPETTLSICVPHVTICRLLGSNCSDVVEHIGPTTRSRERIWESGWRFLIALPNPDANALEKAWSDLVQEWKSCLIDTNFQSFHIAQFILLYYLKCSVTHKQFGIRELSSNILNLH